MDATTAVREAVDAMNDVVAQDGGAVTLTEHDVDNEVVRVQFSAGTNDDCPTCQITPDMLETFIGEAIRMRGASVQKIIVA